MNSIVARFQFKKNPLKAVGRELWGGRHEDTEESKKGDCDHHKHQDAVVLDLNGPCAKGKITEHPASIFEPQLC